MKKSTRILLLSAKMSLVAGILWYLIRSGKLDLSTLDLYFKDPMLIFVNLLVWFGGSLLLTSYRWNMLMKGMGLEIPLRRVVNLNFIGFFFNTIAPGAIGGDFVKAFYLYRDQKEGSKTPAMLAILLDRVVGLYCVFLIATVAILSFLNHFSGNPTLATIAACAVLGFATMTLGLLVLFLARKPVESNALYRFLGRSYPGFAILQKIFLSLFLLKEKPSYFIKAVLAGIIYQLVYMSIFAFVTVRMGNPFSLPDFAAIFPVGFIVAALPIAPGGLGVGHLAFDQLFGIIGILHGANIYNIIFIGQSALNLLGLIPYLMLKKESKSVPLVSEIKSSN